MGRYRANRLTAEIIYYSVSICVISKNNLKLLYLLVKVDLKLFLGTILFIIISELMGYNFSNRVFIRLFNFE